MRTVRHSFTVPFMGCLLAAQVMFGQTAQVMAAGFTKDLYLNDGDVRIASQEAILNRVNRVYASIHSSSKSDLTGSVSFYDETVQEYINAQQPISVLGEKTDDVFVDWKPTRYGEHVIAVRIEPAVTEGNDPSNDKIRTTIFVDRDTDGDKTGDRYDGDIDNDGLTNQQEKIVGTNPFRKDMDGDKVVDGKDAFPLDSTRWEKPATSSGSSSSGGQGQAQSQVIQTNGSTHSGNTVTFNALQTDPKQKIVTYDWNFGDGKKETGVVVDHIYRRPGTYLVQLMMKDAQGQSYATKQLVTIGRPWKTIAMAIGLALLILGWIILLFLKRKKRSEPIKKASVSPRLKKSLPRSKK